MKTYLRDNGTGAFDTPDASAINYTAGTIEFPPDKVVGLPKPRYVYSVDESSPANGVVGVANGIDFTLVQGVYGTGQVKVTYSVNNTATSASETANSSMVFVIPQLNPGQLVTESIVFTIDSNVYITRGSNVYLFNGDNVLNLPTVSGDYDASTGVIKMIAGITGTVTILGAAQYLAPNVMTKAAFIIAAAPVLPSSLTVSVEDLSGVIHVATIDNSGNFTDSFIHGKCDLESGYATIRFGTEETITPAIQALPEYDVNQVLANGKWFLSKEVRAESMVYTATGSTYFPTSADILGADTTRLPSDGRVPVFKTGDTVVLLNDSTVSGTYTSGQVVNVGVTDVNRITLYDNLGSELPSLAVGTINLVAGTVTLGNVTGISQPIQIVSRIESTHLVTDVDVANTIGINPPAPRDYPANTTLVCNAVLHGDLQAFGTDPFTQQTWTNVWSDIQIGNGTIGQPNPLAFPPQFTNFGTIDERWAIIFASTSTVNVIGEQSGQVVTGLSSSGIIAPINPLSSTPYFVLPANFLGAGWSTGNVVRFNTTAANRGVTVVKTTSPGVATSTDYKFCLEMRIDVGN